MRKQLVDAASRASLLMAQAATGAVATRPRGELCVRLALQHIFQVRMRVEPVELGDWVKLITAAAR